MNGYLNANSWEARKDGPPLYLLDLLNNEELKIAEKELIKALGSKDSWLMTALGHIKSTSALPYLHALLITAKPYTRLITAHSIFKISGDPEMIDITVETIYKINDESEMIDVIYLLPDYKSNRTQEILHQLTNSDFYLIAYNAARALDQPTDMVVEKFRNKSTQQKQRTSSFPHKIVSWFKNTFR